MSSTRIRVDALGESFASLIAAESTAMGRDFTNVANEVRQYAAERMLHLSTIVGEKGYAEALQAERDNVILKMGIKAVQTADAFDQRLIGIVAGSLAIGARALAGA